MNESSSIFEGIIEMTIFFAVKVLVSALIIAVASELAKKYSFFAAIILALPLTSLLALFWVNVETGDKVKLASLSWGVFWLVPPSLVFFPIFATLISRDFPFWLSFLLAAVLTGAVFFFYSKVLGIFGINV